MVKSKVNMVKQLEEKLFEFPGLVDKLSSKDPKYLEQFINWLNQSEEILASYNLSTVSELAGLRSKIIASRFTDTKLRSVKKMQLQIASSIMQDAQAIIHDSLRPFKILMDESRDLIRQLLVIVNQANVVKNTEDIPFQHLLETIWQFILSNEQLSAGAQKLKSSFNRTDINMLLASEICLEDW